MKSAPTHRPLTPSQARQNAVEKQKIEGGSVVSGQSRKMVSENSWIKIGQPQASMEDEADVHTEKKPIEHQIFQDAGQKSEKSMHSRIAPECKKR